ncbi:MAG TPA: response regulator, partial [Polyangia bacterium]|nr:response regulator [Polyangia bacterium]
MGARPRIVLADDELNLRKVLGAILQRDGYEILEARDGEEALALVAANPGIAAVITDLRMPRLDGMGLLRRVVAEHPDVPVVMITAHGSVDSAVEAVKLGAFDYIEKPFEQLQIQQVVAKAIRTHELDKRAPRVQQTTSPAGRFG